MVVVVVGVAVVVGVGVVVGVAVVVGVVVGVAVVVGVVLAVGIVVAVGVGLVTKVRRKEMIWGWGDDNRLGDLGMVDRHRKRAYAEGFRDGLLVGCILVVAFGGALSLALKYWGRI